MAITPNGIESLSSIDTYVEWLKREFATVLTGYHILWNKRSLMEPHQRMSRKRLQNVRWKQHIVDVIEVSEIGTTASDGPRRVVASVSNKGFGVSLRSALRKTELRLRQEVQGGTFNERQASKAPRRAS